MKKVTNLPLQYFPLQTVIIGRKATINCFKLLRFLNIRTNKKIWVKDFLILSSLEETVPPRLVFQQGVFTFTKLCLGYTIFCPPDMKFSSYSLQISNLLIATVFHATGCADFTYFQFFYSK